MGACEDGRTYRELGEMCLRSFEGLCFVILGHFWWERRGDAAPWIRRLEFRVERES